MFTCACGQPIWAVQARHPVSAVSGIVSIKALYGFDTRPAAPGAVVCQILNYQPDCGVRVTQWSAGMIDADASGVIDSLDVQRLVAVRLAVVARSRQVDKPAAGAVSRTASIPANAALPTVFSTRNRRHRHRTHPGQCGCGGRHGGLELLSLSYL